MALKFEKLDEGQYRLDVKGYVCPQPQIYTKKALEKLQPGEVLELLFDNPSSGESISAMIDQDGNKLIEQKQEEGQYLWRIEKA
jgi:tRNA 2-thiouridine synthesizing protein A